MPFSYFDTMIAAYLLDSSGRRFRLSDLASKYLDYKMSEYEDVTGKGKNQITFDEVPVDKATQYSAEDAEITYSLVSVLEPLLKKEGLLDLFYNIEMPLVFVLENMERTGVKIDIPLLKKISHDFAEKMGVLEMTIYALAGEPFNINSPKQLQQILFEKLKLPVKKKTKTGSSTDISVLEELASEHELPKRMVEYRQYQKLKSTYVDALPLLVHPQTGRVHTSFNQTVTATGRLSSSDPNLQNIPIRSDMGKEIRKAFIAEKGNVIVSADYSQIELRIFAHIANDENMITAFQKGEDIHTATASRVFNIPLDQVTSDQRRYAKTINFGLMYGMGPFRLSKELNLSMDEAKKFIENYFNLYPSIQKCIVQIIEQAKDRGYVETLFGRKRYIPELNNMNRNIQELGKREAVNTVIQGTAADIIKVAMVSIYKKFNEQKLYSKMILQIHDELVFEIPQKELSEVKSIILQDMESVIPLKAPLKVDIGVGENWLEAH
jgi:DNA polymerase-1